MSTFRGTIVHPRPRSGLAESVGLALPPRGAAPLAEFTRSIRLRHAQFGPETERRQVARKAPGEARAVVRPGLEPTAAGRE